MIGFCLSTQDLRIPSASKYNLEQGGWVLLSFKALAGSKAICYTGLPDYLTVLPEIQYWSPLASCYTILGWAWVCRDIWDIISRTKWAFFFHLTYNMNTRLSISSGSACLGVSTGTLSTSVAINHLTTVVSHLLIWKILMSCLKHGRIKEFHYGIVQGAIEMFSWEYHYRLWAKAFL